MEDRTNVVKECSAVNCGRGPVVSTVISRRLATHDEVLKERAEILVQLDVYCLGGSSLLDQFVWNLNLFSSVCDQPDTR